LGLIGDASEEIGVEIELFFSVNGTGGTVFPFVVVNYSDGLSLGWNGYGVCVFWLEFFA
jgi:hypothetical protein